MKPSLTPLNEGIALGHIFLGSLLYFWYVALTDTALKLAMYVSASSSDDECLKKPRLDF